jgi:predicted helicase
MKLKRSGQDVVLCPIERSSPARRLRPLVEAAGVACLEAACDPVEREYRVAAQVCRLLMPGLSRPGWKWVEDQLPQPWQEWFCQDCGVDEGLARAAEALAKLPDFDALASFYEQFLQAHHPRARKRHGAFYTPPEVARFIIRSVDQSLREEFGLKRGLLEPNNWVRILDPALGAGMFLTELLLHARRHANDDAWNETVAALLPKIGGIEIVPAAALIAVVRMAAVLERTGYSFNSDARLHLQVGDALAQPLRPAWSVIVGNPPFSGISATKHEWLDTLLRGTGPGGEPRASYFEFAGAPLGERKHWLQDDYVKFLRVAHEQIETAGRGIVALVTNHGYLDNITFRGLREKLAQSFSHITVIDLHGSAKQRERSPDGSRDENVFAIEQGVAIGLFRRVPECANETHLERGDLWGSRSAKLAALDREPADTALRRIDSWTPGNAFHAAASSSLPIDDSAWPLDKAMPLNSTAPVTARDHFVIAMTRKELIERCEAFCDPSLTNDEIRLRYFQRTRSTLYAAGDTRGWKLAEARTGLRNRDWQANIRRILYRPFDWRYVLWDETMIDWPRGEVMSQMLAGPNLAIITRRQSPPGQPWTFAWITDGLTVDGVIRSDNRGSESVFPLWRFDRGNCRANFDPRFLEQFSSAVRTDCDPLDVFYYIYALLHATVYRKLCHAALTTAFPRILWPPSADAYSVMARLGGGLADCHLLRDRYPLPCFVGKAPLTVAPGFPRFDRGRLLLDQTSYFEGIEPAAANFVVGSHRPAIKLLKDRKGRPLSGDDLLLLGQALGAMQRATEIVSELDAAVLELDFPLRAAGGGGI